MKTVLHLGAGNQHAPEDRYPPSEWREVTVDLDERQAPDIVADVCEVPLPDGYADAIFCSHVLEHVPEIVLPRTLGEWRRLLKPDGELVVRVPDLQVAARWIAEGRPCHVMYYANTSVDGHHPIRPIDLVYGAAPMLGGHPLMRHATGFTHDTLAWWLSLAGFVGEVVPCDTYGLEARVRRNGTPVAYEHDPDKVLILVQQGATMESHPPEEPAETPTENEPPDLPTSRAQVSEQVSVSVADADSDE